MIYDTILNSYLRRKHTLSMILLTCLMHSVAVGALSLEHSFDGQNFKRVAPLQLPEVRSPFENTRSTRTTWK